MKRIGAEDIEDLCVGAAFLATGGGGDPYVSRLLAERLLARHGPARLLAPADVSDDMHVVSVGMVGAPTVTLEQLPVENEALDALNRYEEVAGRRADAVIPFEVGGGNSTVPLFVAAMKGIPCVDGDGMGRALPEAQMMTFPIYGARPTPAVVTDPFGNHAVLDCPDAASFEREIRAKAVAMGGMVSSAEHGMDGALVRRSAIPGTISFARRLGGLLRSHGGLIDAIEPSLLALFADSEYGEVRRLFSGKVLDSRRRIVDGYDVGSAVLQGFDDPGARMTLLIRNEYLAAKIGDRVAASVPDLICVVERETSRPLNAERMRYGQRVSVFAVGCNGRYRTPEALAVAGPRAFGFDFDFTPIEETA